jgi:hypothetical protein
MADFKADYLLAMDVDAWSELTTQQQSDGIESFRLYWAKQLPGVAG